MGKDIGFKCGDRMHRPRQRTELRLCVADLVQSVRFRNGCLMVIGLQSKDRGLQEKVRGHLSSKERSIRSGEAVETIDMRSS